MLMVSLESDQHEAMLAFMASPLGVFGPVSAGRSPETAIPAHGAIS